MSRAATACNRLGGQLFLRLLRHDSDNGVILSLAEVDAEEKRPVRNRRNCLG